MARDLSLEDVGDVVERQYPGPLARIARRCRIALKADLGDRHKLLVDLFEALVKLTTITFLQEARTLCPTLRERLPQKEKALEFLKHPSAGGWVSLLHALCDTDLSDVQGLWMPRIVAWYRKPRSPETTSGLRLLGKIQGLSFEKHSTAPHAETLRALVTYRNKHLAHAATFTEETLAGRIPLLQGSLAYLLSSVGFFSDMKVFFADRIEVLDNDRWLVHAQRLDGAGEEPADLTTTTRLERSELYLADRPSGELARAPVPLSPFLLWHVNPERRQRETFFFNDAWRTKLEYISYESGSHYYHHELHSGFKELVNLKTAPGTSEDAYGHLQPEERAEGAERHHKRALMEMEADRPESALECLEQSGAFEARAETFVTMAQIQHQLGDPPAAFLKTLERAFELEPSNAKALELRTRLLARPAESSGPSGAPGASGAHTTFHALTPRPMRDFALLWWWGLLTAWYAASSATEWLLTGNEAELLPKALQLLCSVVLVTGVVGGHVLFHRLRLPLSLQLQSMRLDRFNQWFAQAAEATFGVTETRDGRVRFAGTLRRERSYYLGGLVWVLVVTTAAFFLSSSQRVNASLWPVRYVDYGLILFTAWPAVRYLAMSVLFASRFSRLSLKPSLTTLQDDGIRAFGPMLVFNSAVASLAYAAYWLLASLVVQTDVPYDLFFLAVTTLIVSGWSVVMPLMIQRAVQESRSRAVHAYTEHIEIAFKAFLEHPDEPELKRFSWLRSQQKVLRKISVWPLTLPETLLAIVGLNVVLLAVDTWYLGLRLGWWPHFLPL